MSRTYRNTRYARTYARKVSYRRQRRETYFWVQELKEEGFHPRARDLKLSCEHYINSYNDYRVSAVYEQEYLAKKVDGVITEINDWHHYYRYYVFNKTFYKLLEKSTNKIKRRENARYFKRSLRSRY